MDGRERGYGMSLREEQCKKVCRILDDVLANRPTERDSLIVAVRKAFKAMAEPHWIPVTERMPETEGDYLITDDSGGVKTIEVDSFFILDDGKKMWCYSQNPVAWMELPEAYKGETE
jgi:hypothetical protein